jgi:BirA family biotin operon repressor/biotin-[acetyl-CoA-carboxylase] ligase
VIVGAGVNLTVPDFPAGAGAISLHTVAESVPSAGTLLESWLRHLDSRLATLEQHGLPGLLNDWRRLAAGLGSAVSVRTPSGLVEGVAADVRDDGALLVNTADGMVAILAGDVRLLQRYPDVPRMHPD